MKRKNFTLVIIAIVIVGVGIGWFTRTPTAAPEKNGVVTIPAKIAARGPVTLIAQVALPKAPAVPAGGKTVLDDALISTDPQADLKTAIPDIERLFRAGGSEAVALAYTAPDYLHSHPAEADALKAAVAKATGNSTPQLPAQMMNEAFAVSFEAIENQIPTLNATGNEATYIYTPPTKAEMQTGTFAGTGQQSSVAFIKINGKWYIKWPD